MILFIVKHQGLKKMFGDWFQKIKKSEENVKNYSK